MNSVVFGSRGCSSSGLAIADTQVGAVASRPAIADMGAASATKACASRAGAPRTQHQLTAGRRACELWRGRARPVAAPASSGPGRAAAGEAAMAACLRTLNAGRKLCSVLPQCFFALYGCFPLEK